MILSPKMEIYSPYGLLQNGLLLICSIAANLINGQPVGFRNALKKPKTELIYVHDIGIVNH